VLLLTRALVGSMLFELASPATARQLVAALAPARRAAHAWVLARRHGRDKTLPTLRAPSLRHGAYRRSRPTAGPLPGATRTRTPWITIAPPEATTSGAAVDHDRAVRWITTRAPLKRFARADHLVLKDIKIGGVGLDPLRKPLPRR